MNKERVVAIGLKNPDNTAYTVLVALRRLGVDVDRVERSEIWHFEDGGDASTFAERLEANETIFNPNKHVFTELVEAAPRAGEAWIGGVEGRHDEVREHLGGKGIEGVTRARRYVGWLLRDAGGVPLGRDSIAAAVERLLCNPAIEKALY